MSNYLGDDAEKDAKAIIDAGTTIPAGTTGPVVPVVVDTMKAAIRPPVPWWVWLIAGYLVMRGRR